MADASEYVIETDRLTRCFGSRCVVDDLDLHIPRGSIYGFLGRNGAGKSTTIRMLVGLLAPTRGWSRLLGCDSLSLTPRMLSRIGYLAEGHHVYDWMTVSECRQFQKEGYAHWNDRIFDSILEQFGISRRAAARALSRGERAGLCLALTLAPEPELLILDDPALGLDAVARRNLLQAMIQATRNAGQTILFSSHQLGDVDRVADRIAVIGRGVLRADCSLERFRASVRRFALPLADVSVATARIPGIVHIERDEHEAKITIAGYDDRVRGTLTSLAGGDCREAPLDFEEAFVHYVGDPAGDLLAPPASEETR